MREPIIKPGGWWPVAFPSGEYVLIYPNSHLETHLGRMALPGESIRYIDATVAGGFKFAGQAQDTPGVTWQWFGTWDKVPFATGRGVYDLSGVYRDAMPAGLQFVTPDGTLVSRLDGYGPWHGLWERIEFDDGLAVGQPQAGGVAFWDGAQLRHLGYHDGQGRFVPETGDCYFLKVRQAGPDVTIAFLKASLGAVIYHATIAELRALPTYPAVLAPNPPQPPPVPPPEPPAMSIPDHSSIVQRVNSEHPHLIQQNTAETVREFYWRAAWALHQHDPKWGMLSKSAGENHQVIEGLRVAVDAVAYQGETPIVDILSSAGDGPGTGGVTWNVDPHRRESNEWVRPPRFPGVSPGEPGEEPDQPDPPPPDGAELAALQATVTDLQRRLAGLEAGQREIVADLLNLRQHPVDEAAVRAFIKLELSALTTAQKLRAKGRVGSGFLSVTADIPVVLVD